jgi:hypothetical protein
VRVAARFLDDYARELRNIGQRAFRQRYRVPMLIVAGRIVPLAKRPRAAGSDVRTVLDRADPATALFNRVFPLAKAAPPATGPVVVGRTDDREVDVSIPDFSISKKHCAFVSRDGIAAIRDCGSTNGTLVNGAAVAGHQLVDLCGGEILTLGRLELKFETPSGFAELVTGSF